MHLTYAKKHASETTGFRRRNGEFVSCTRAHLPFAIRCVSFVHNSNKRLMLCRPCACYMDLLHTHSACVLVFVHASEVGSLAGHDVEITQHASWISMIIHAHVPTMLYLFPTTQKRTTLWILSHQTIYSALSIDCQKLAQNGAEDRYQSIQYVVAARMISST